MLFAAFDENLGSNVGLRQEGKIGATPSEFSVADRLHQSAVPHGQSALERGRDRKFRATGVQRGSLERPRGQDVKLPRAARDVLCGEPAKDSRAFQPLRHTPNELAAATFSRSCGLTIPARQPRSTPEPTPE